MAEAEPGRGRGQLEPTSPAAEAYRSLRTSLQFARQAHELRTLLVTSPAAAEGKTSTVANLGAVFAQAGERVVLVSCDLRRPRLGQFFGIDEQAGLTTVLLGQQTLEQALQQVPGLRRPMGARRGAGSAEPGGTARRARSREVFAALPGELRPGAGGQPAGAAGHRRHGPVQLCRRHAARRRRRARPGGPSCSAPRSGWPRPKPPVVGIVLNEVTKQSAYGSGYGYGLRIRLLCTRCVAGTRPGEWQRSPRARRRGHRTK